MVTFKKAGPRWRFELYSFDFAVGALLLALIAAYTLGTFGSELGFSDRMLVSGRMNQALVFVAGAVFMLGNMLFLSAVSLLGMSAAFPLCFGLATIVAVLPQAMSAHMLPFGGGMALLAGTVLLAIAAIRIHDKAGKASAASQAAAAAQLRPGVRTQVKKRTGAIKGIVVGVIGGLFLGASFPIADRGISGDFGLGPYAGLLLFSVAGLLSTLVLNLYFMNIAIEGGAIGFNAYFKGEPRQHFLGFAGGALCAVGLLTASLAMSAPTQVAPNAILMAVIPLAAVLLGVFWGRRAKEFANAPAATRTLLFVAGVVFLGGVSLIALGTSH